MELLLGIAVLAILTTLAVPSFTQFIQNNRLAGQANEMVASFQFARSEALKRGQQVQVCTSSDGSGCGGNWSEGWIAIVDPGGDDEEVLRVWASPGDDFQFTAGVNVAQFAPAGCLDTNDDGQCTLDDGDLEFELSLEGCTNDNARRVLIERTGRVASQRVDCTP